MTVASIVTTVEEAKAFYRTEYIPIPKYMVERADITATNAKGQETMIKNQTAYYKVVRCNRTAGDDKISKKNYEAMGDSNDLNGDIGREWLALYAVKVYFQRAKIAGAQSLRAEGSIFSGGAGIVLGGGVGLVVGALFGGLIVSRRKKKVEVEE